MLLAWCSNTMLDDDDNKIHAPDVVDGGSVLPVLPVLPGLQSRSILPGSLSQGLSHSSRAPTAFPTLFFFLSLGVMWWHTVDKWRS